MFLEHSCAWWHILVQRDRPGLCTPNSQSDRRLRAILAASEAHLSMVSNHLLVSTRTAFILVVLLLTTIRLIAFSRRRSWTWRWSGTLLSAFRRSRLRRDDKPLARKGPEQQRTQNICQTYDVCQNALCLEGTNTLIIDVTRSQYRFVGATSHYLLTLIQQTQCFCQQVWAPCEQRECLIELNRDVPT